MGIGDIIKSPVISPVREFFPVDPQEERFQENLQRLIYLWISTEFPSWHHEFTPGHPRNSQAMTATIPGSEKPCAGLVYFKSIFDPCWSDEDVAELQGADHTWMLLILNPCERFAEIESPLRDIAARLQKLAVWRPDTPSTIELENLRRLASEIPSEITEDTVAGNTAWHDAHQILNTLYVIRGQWATASDRHVIGDKISCQTVYQHVSARLSALPRQTQSLDSPGIPIGVSAAAESQILYWSALLAGRPEVRESKLEQARDHLIAWWTNSAEKISAKTPELPESFMTTHVGREIKFVEAALLGMRPVFQNLRSGAVSLREAVNQVGLGFSWDESRFIKWRQALDNLAGLILWLPAFIHAQEYLRAAFPLGQERLDRLCEELIQSIDEPHQFLETKARNEFDEKFLEFKKGYMDCYYSLHEDALHVALDLKNDESGVDPAALRNLELLSGLQYTDKSYLNRVNVLARWVQHNQCSLPLRRILERYPRCYCNFNPSANRQPAGLASQINSVIQEGIEYFRTTLRRCQNLILDEIKIQETHESTSAQIAALFGYGAMIPIKAQTIEILNKIIRKNPSYFHTKIRK
jgi:hypothetical protein